MTVSMHSVIPFKEKKTYFNTVGMVISHVVYTSAYFRCVFTNRIDDNLVCESVTTFIRGRDGSVDSLITEITEYAGAVLLGEAHIQIRQLSRSLINELVDNDN